MTPPSAGVSGSHDEVLAALARVVDPLPAAEDRPGQREMAERVADAIEHGRHLVVQAGTGTGKTLAYLVPVDRRRAAGVVVATATKALQDQLATKDLPFLDRATRHRFRLVGAEGPQQLPLPATAARGERPRPTGNSSSRRWPSTTRAEIKKLAEWAGETRTGDQAELTWTPTDAAWRSVSVGSDECPGADRCPLGEPCFAEQARRRAAVADVVVVNTHLYGLHVGSGGVILPEHDVVVFDEAHVLEDVMSDTVGVTIAPGGSRPWRRASAASSRIPKLVGSIAELAEALRDVLATTSGAAADSAPPAIREVLAEARSGCGAMGETLAAIEPGIDDAKQRKLRAQTMNDRTIEQVDIALGEHDGYVEFVSGSPESPRLEIAPLDVGPQLTEGVWDARRRSSRAQPSPRRSPPASGWSPTGWTWPTSGAPSTTSTTRSCTARCTCPIRVRTGYRAGVHDELASLITAAGGRTLALFTSWKAMDEAAEAVRGRVPFRILTQRDLPKPALVRTFADDEATCLFATAGLFQGVDVPGRRCRSSSSTGSRSRGPTIRSCRRAASCSDAARSRDRHPSGGDDARPGVRPPDPHCRRPRGRRRARSTARCRQLPVGHRAGAPTDAAHP